LHLAERLEHFFGVFFFFSLFAAGGPLHDLPPRPQYAGIYTCYLMIVVAWSLEIPTMTYTGHPKLALAKIKPSFYRYIEPNGRRSLERLSRVALMLFDHSRTFHHHNNDNETFKTWTAGAVQESVCRL
jgi:hypothetical protein